MLSDQSATSIRNLVRLTIKTYAYYNYMGFLYKWGTYPNLKIKLALNTNQSINLTLIICHFLSKCGTLKTRHWYVVSLAGTWNYKIKMNIATFVSTGTDMSISYKIKKNTAIFVSTGASMSISYKIKKNTAIFVSTGASMLISYKIKKNTATFVSTGASMLIS